jgi:ion channel-forming bestrophin family protein
MVIDSITICNLLTMYTRRRISVRIILLFSWAYLLFYFLYSGAVVYLYHYMDWKQLALPFIPIGMIATAVAFYIGFKNNSAYDRLWEGRRIWGALVNASRSWGATVIDYIQNNDAVKKELIYRHLAFINALRNQLRRNSIWKVHQTDRKIVEHFDVFKQETLDAELLHFLTEEEVKHVSTKSNAAAQLLKKQSAVLQHLHQQGSLSELKQIELEKLLMEFYNQQGACERIKNFPFPRQYAYFSFIFTWVLVLILPYGLLNEFQKLGTSFIWLTIPAHMLISWIFFTMERVGDTSENPFENGINDVPMTAICRTIEIDLKEMLGGETIPEKIQPVNNILM